MENEEDFTFCRVGSPVDGVADDIDRIHINDRNSLAVDTLGGDQYSGNIWNVNASSRKQETVGSLSFSVIDASSRKEELKPRQTTKEGAGNSSKFSPEQKTSARKPTARAKVPFEKGYSQMDWLKLTQTHPDLAGLKGQSNRRLISLNEVKQHQSEGSMWTVLKGRVYNIAPYMKFHPGGVDMLRKAVGKDCTALFNKYHAWVNAEFMLEKCLVGILEEGK